MDANTEGLDPKTFEELAKAFHTATGFVAPGQLVPTGKGEVWKEQGKAAWSAWCLQEANIETLQKEKGILESEKTAIKNDYARFERSTRKEIKDRDEALINYQLERKNAEVAAFAAGVSYGTFLAPENVTNEEIEANAREWFESLDERKKTVGAENLATKTNKGKIR